MIDKTVKPARPQEPVGQDPFNCYVLDDDTVWTEFYHTGDGYLLRFPGLADFEVSIDGSKVVAYPTKGTDEATIEHLYINQLVPLALSRQGQPAFHASVVTFGGGAIAFLGQSGTGKSTLAASFALSGEMFLTDDALLVEESDDGCRVRPSHASLRLWNDSVEAIVGNDIQTAGPISYSDKAQLLAGEALAFCNESQPLAGAYVLEQNDVSSVLIRELTGLDRYMAWLGNSFLLDVVDNDLLARHFDWTHRISGKVPTFALDFPRDYDILPEVRAAIREHAGALT